MSNSSAKGENPTGCRAATDHQIPAESSYSKNKINEEIDDFYGWGIHKPVECICDLLNHSMDGPKLCDEHLRELVFEATRIIRFITAVGEHVNR